MTSIKPSGKQLNIPSIATELTTDVAAVALLDAEYLRVDNNNNTSVVDLTTSQAIGGTKTFTGDIIVDGEAILNNATIKSSGELDVGDAIVTLNAGEVGTPSVNAGIEIERGTSTNAQLLWNESVDRWQGGIAGALLTIVLDDDSRLTDTRVPTAHVHDATDITTGTLPNARVSVGNVTQHQSALVITESQISDMGSYLPIGGGTLTGNLTIDTATPILVIKAAGTGQSTNLQFKDSANAITGDLYVESGGDQRVIMRKRTGGTVDNTFVLNNGYTSLDDPRTAVMGTSSASLTTKAYVDGGFLPLTGGIVAGNLTVDGSFKTDSLGADSAAFIFNTAPIRYSAGAISSVVNNNDLIYKSYVDDNFVSISTNQTITGTKTFSSTAQFNGYATFNVGARFNVNPLVQRDGYPSLTLNRTNAGSVYGLHQISFQTDGVEQGFIKYHHDDEQMLFKVEVAGGTDTTVTFDDGGVVSNKQFRSLVATPTDSAHLTRKDYVDALIASIPSVVTDHGALTGLADDDHPHYAKKAGDTFTGNINVTTSSGVASTTLRSSGDTDLSYFTMRNNLTTQGQLIGLDGRFLIRRPGGSGGTDTDLNLYPTYITVSKEMRGVDGTVNTSFTTKGYVDDNFVDLTTNQIIGGMKTFSAADNTMVINATTGNSMIQWQRNGNRTSEIEATPSANIVRQFNSSDDETFAVVVDSDWLSYRDEQAHTKLGIVGTTHALLVYPSSTTTTSNSGLYLTAYTGTESRSLGIKVPSNLSVEYNIVMPTTKPVVGKQLQVSSVVGQDVFMDWV
jgi:hypothetical protein